MERAIQPTWHNCSKFPKLTLINAIDMCREKFNMFIFECTGVLEQDFKIQKSNRKCQLSLVDSGFSSSSTSTTEQTTTILFCNSLILKHSTKKWEFQGSWPLQCTELHILTPWVQMSGSHYALKLKHSTVHSCKATENTKKRGLQELLITSSFHSGF